jgi:hypothetical protein
MSGNPSAKNLSAALSWGEFIARRSTASIIIAAFATAENNRGDYGRRERSLVIS